MPEPIAERAVGPYIAAAGQYWRAGWRGVLPLPVRAKTFPPTGYTGKAGHWPSAADVLAWSEDRPDANIALRMPPHVVGIDVDHYGDKTGGDTLAKLEAAHGALPATWMSTSRDDGHSGIRFYRVPEGLAWPGEAGHDIEVIQTGHRYAVAAPSVHPDTAGTYRWINPAGIPVIGDVPHVDDLPDLPDAWITALTGGELATDTPKLDLPDPAVAAWLEARPQGSPCRAVQRAEQRWTTDLAAPGAQRHNIARDASMRLTRLAGEGHVGAAANLDQLRNAFLTAATADGSRDSSEAAAEWKRLVTGAVQIAAAAPIGDVDPCEQPFADLIPTKPTQTVALPPQQPIAPTAVPSPEHQPDAIHDPSPPPDRERTSWWPVDLTVAISGDNPEPPPTHLSRNDGQALFYPGKVNGLIAPSESGKTWVALLAVQQALDDGVNVTYLDFEDTAPGIVHRLLTMSTNPDVLRERFAYIGPDAALDIVGGNDLAEHLDTWQPGLVIVDGVNAAMTLLGLDLISNTDATRFAQTLLRPMALRGAAVIYIDHTPKSKENDSKGGIGAQAKRAMTTGCALRVEIVKEFGIGQSGKLRLRVDKDRPGHVRGASLPGNGGHWAGDVDLTSNPDDSLTVTVTAPSNRPEGAQPFRPTHLMERVSAFLQTVPEGVSKAAIEREVKGDDKAIRTAVDRLVEEGYATREAGLRNAVSVRHVRPYTELSDLGATPVFSPNATPQVRRLEDTTPVDLGVDLRGALKSNEKMSTSVSTPVGHSRTSATSVDLGVTSVPPGSTEVDGWTQRPSEEGLRQAPYVVGAGSTEVVAPVGAPGKQDQKTLSPVAVEERACRACGVILDSGHMLIGGRCSDCISAGREARP